MNVGGPKFPPDPNPISRTGGPGGPGNAGGPGRPGFPGDTSITAPVGNPESVRIAVASVRNEIATGVTPKNPDAVSRRLVETYVEQQFGHLVDPAGIKQMAVSLHDMMTSDPVLHGQLESVVTPLVT